MILDVHSVLGLDCCEERDQFVLVEENGTGALGEVAHDLEDDRGESVLAANGVGDYKSIEVK